MSLVALGRRADGTALLPGERPPRKERWGSTQAPEDFMCAVTTEVSERELVTYSLQVRMEEIGRALRTGTFIPPDGRRSPSPQPTYDASGKRTNTRELRYKRRAEEERAALLEEMFRNDPSLKPASDATVSVSRSGKPTENVYIPSEEFPDVNFFGLIVGPRGKSLQEIERKTGAKVSIRGKGSVKEGKGSDESQQDALHCIVTADTEEELHAAVNMLNGIIETAASTPEGQNSHKRLQLRELALLNGTLREDDFDPAAGPICQNCGLAGHRRYDCPYGPNVTQSIRCPICGAYGHTARDCRVDTSAGNTFEQDYEGVLSDFGVSEATLNARDEYGNRIPPWHIASNWPDVSLPVSAPEADPAYAYPYGTYDPALYYHRHGYNVMPADPTGEALPPPEDLPPPAA